ncbi:RNA-guided endonuclease InsQ/TnpB family protein [Nonomuraea aurantiaca]|uniref:RNA-guided endonuclease InsQ/TnpB family protein n=1 Tax=Nonomuraea aurantiaca TaxID=2878562 RepID=UPI001CDA3201|nr:RNA-guided endonuclease TnpB family protein [Nonomuraea aurantiaca]MCA2225304.1 transposase [Nonomuraea aurantiaca]
MAIRRSATKRHGLPTTVQLRLTPAPAQADALAAAVLLCNEAATLISRLAFQYRVFTVLELHRLAYYDARAQLAGLGAQAAVRAIARVAGAYANRRASKKRAHIFRPHGAVPYDARLMSFNRDARTVSLWTPTGRVTVPYTGRPKDLKTIEALPLGEADLICRRGEWLLQVALTLPKPPVREPVGGFLGVDQGVANLAVTSDGAVLPGPALPGPVGGNGHVRTLRKRRRRQRRRLQRKGTSAARRVLRRLSGREHRMMTDLNHQISKYVVREAERTDRGVALEDLQGIRGRVRAHRFQRRTLHNWAFAQQITFTRYKAARAGIAFVLVDPAYTSQACPECGHISRANRPARGRFVCKRCGLAGHADHIAARNIATRGAAGWAAINQPHATGLPSPRRDRESKPPASTGGS